MYRIPADNPVRRRLFPAEEGDEAKVENFINVLQETAARDRLEKMKKWNFDFENDVPLDGKYVWYRLEKPDEWVGFDFDDGGDVIDMDIPTNTGNFLPIKSENEATPKAKNDKMDLENKLIRKRKLNFARNATDNFARRRINF